MSDKIILKSVITCPICGYAKEEQMPADACQYFYRCEQCKTILKPLSGNCCVYCSYGTVKCPPRAGKWLAQLHSLIGRKNQFGK